MKDDDKYLWIPMYVIQEMASQEHENVFHLGLHMSALNHDDTAPYE